MTTILMPEGRQRYYNNDGTLAVGCKLYTYAAGTTTPKNAYTDSAGLVPHQNPITLDAKGEAVIFWDGAYKVDLKTAEGVQITGYPVDDVNTDPANVWTLAARLLLTTGAGLVGYASDAIYSIGTVGKQLQAFTASAGASLIGFIQAGASAVANTSEKKMREQVSVFDFMTTAERNDVRAGTALLDVTAAVQAALDYVYSVQLLVQEANDYRTVTSPRLYFPFGRYSVTALTMHESLDAYGDRAVIAGSSALSDILTSSTLRWLSLEGLCFIGGKSHLNMGNANYDATRVTVKKCEFHLGADFAIQMAVYGGVYTHLSATFHFADCKFMHNMQVIRTVADYAIFERCDIYPNKDNFTANTACMVVDTGDGNPRLYLTDCTGVPVMGTHGVDRLANVRWIDQKQGDVICTRTRFGGEGGGMTPIYFSAPPATVNPYIGAQISIIDCEIAAGPQAAVDSGVIYLNGEVPQQISILNTRGPYLNPYINNRDALVNFATYYSDWETTTSLKAYSYFRMNIENIQSQAPDFTVDRVPLEMIKYTRAKENSVSNSASQFIAAGAAVQLVYDTVEFDNMGSWAVANPGRFYMTNLATRATLQCTVKLDPAIAVGVVELRLYNSSGTQIAAQTLRIDDAAGSGLANTSLTISRNVFTTASPEYFYFALYCSSVGGCDTVAGSVKASILQSDPVG